MTVFVGRVRDHDGGQGVTGLEYSAHPSALDKLRDVCAQVASTYDVTALAAVHRTGTLAIGDIAVICATATGHRGEAFDATRALIDTLKAEVPIWKHQSFADGTEEWVGSPYPLGACLRRAGASSTTTRPYPGRVEILLWLVPPAVVTLLAMAWVSWLGREGRGEVDREEAVRRLSKAMEKDHPGAPAGRDRRPARDRSTGHRRPTRVRTPCAQPPDRRLLSCSRVRGLPA